MRMMRGGGSRSNCSSIVGCLGPACYGCLCVCGVCVCMCVLSVCVCVCLSICKYVRRRINMNWLAAAAAAAAVGEEKGGSFYIKNKNE